MMNADLIRLGRLALSLRRRMPAFMDASDLVAAGWLGLQRGGWARAHGAMLDEIRRWYGNPWDHRTGALLAQQVQLPGRHCPDKLDELPTWDEIADEPEQWHSPQLAVDLSPLSEGERAVMDLLLEGLPVSDVADRVGKSENAVMVARTRAVHRLRAAA